MAVTFTGTTYLSTTSVPGGLNQNSAPHTLACWVYATNNNGSIIGGSTQTSCFVGIVGSTTSGSGYQDATWIGAYSPNGLTNWDQEASNFAQEVFTSPGLTMPQNTWTHIAGTFDGTNAVIYVNGVSQGTMSGGGVATAIAWNRLVIGGFNGDAQDAYVFNRALSAVEIQLLMNGRQFLGNRTSLVGHWPLLGGGNSLVDWSGNGRTLTATGSCPDAARNAPVAWNSRAVLQTLRPGIGPIAGVGASSVSASGTLSIATALTGAGQASVSASATGKEAAALSGTGASSASGAATVSEAAALTGSGQVSVSGAGAFASGSLAGSGATSVSGAATLSEAVALAGVGNVAVAGSAAISQLRSIDGTGASSVSASGTVSRQLQLVGSGDCAVAGSAVVSVATALTGTGQVSVSGAASFNTPSGGSSGDDQPTDRRWLAALGSRRKVRR